MTTVASNADTHEGVWTADRSGALIVGPNAGAIIEGPVGGPITFKVRGEQTNGTFTALET